MSSENTYDVVCSLRCPGCRRLAVGITEASAQCTVDAYLARLANLDFEEWTVQARKRSPTLFPSKYGDNCKTPSAYFEPAAIKTRRAWRGLSV